MGDDLWKGFLVLDAVYACLSGTAQSPWLLCMYGVKGKRGILEKLQANFYVRPLFLVLEVFLFSRNSSFRWWDRFSGISGLGGPGIRVHTLVGVGSTNRPTNQQTNKQTNQTNQN